MNTSKIIEEKQKKITGNPEMRKARNLIPAFFPHHLVTGIKMLLVRIQTN